MWCKTCRIETNEELCPICGSVTIEDLPTEVYWCAHCAVPVIQVENQADKDDLPTGQRYIHHRKRGSNVLKKFKADRITGGVAAYTFLRMSTMEA